MAVADPVLHVLAGPNGAGKSTLAGRMILTTTHLPFVNSDVLAARERDRLLAGRESFVTEST